MLTRCCCGVPAYGEGEFGFRLYQFLGMCSSLCINGLHRCYIGEYLSGFICFVTFGFCCVGQALDVCYFNNEQRIITLNDEIKKCAKEGYRRRMGIPDDQPVDGIQQNRNYIPNNIRFQTRSEDQDSHYPNSSPIFVSTKYSAQLYRYPSQEPNQHINIQQISPQNYAYPQVVYDINHPQNISNIQVLNAQPTYGEIEPDADLK
ncbi:MAG: hypothetical protein EZS28_013877 [Streblomastix strix]|uniref:TM2 domain-containing protein n=1 Tax=Streblomastix strix TaxID=222440 RepID=A0A5J4W6Y0_9EUKA|nr:MAG: hypothetical protein EZS28_013877 [Streblomastix strix]